MEPVFTPTQSVLLDGLRYVLSLTVLIGHGCGFYFGYFGGFFPNVFPYPQSIAVVCFFFLSGLLVTSSQLGGRGQTRGLYAYIFDRSARVYITLVPSLLFVAIADLSALALGAPNALATTYANSSTLIDNLLLIPSVPFGTMRPIWSLMYEWWIYVLFGGLLFIRSNPIVGSFLSIGGAWYTFFVNGRGEAGHIWLIWGLGCACAFLLRYNRLTIPKGRTLTVLALAGFIGAMVAYSVSKDAYNLPAGALLSFAIFGGLNLDATSFRFLLKIKDVLKFLAGFSFTLFLTHYTVMTYVSELLNLTGWLGIIVGVALSHLVAIAIAYYTEFRLGSVKAAVTAIRARQLYTAK